MYVVRTRVGGAYEDVRDEALAYNQLGRTRLVLVCSDEGRLVVDSDAAREEAECLEGSAGESASVVGWRALSITEGALEELFVGYAVLVLFGAGLA